MMPTATFRSIKRSLEDDVLAEFSGPQLRHCYLPKWQPTASVGQKTTVFGPIGLNEPSTGSLCSKFLVKQSRCWRLLAHFLNYGCYIFPWTHSSSEYASCLFCPITNDWSTYSSESRLLCHNFLRSFSLEANFQYEVCLLYFEIWQP